MWQGKPRKLSLSPIQREVLGMLEEAGEENMPTIINTLGLKFSDLSHEELRRKVGDAVEGLSRYGFVYLSPVADVTHMASVVLTAAGRNALRK
jgi:hypothetical protein